MTPHLFPHAPQLAGSLSTLVQVPLLQRWSGSVQVHVALVHASSTEHAAAHLPQLVRSRVKSTHEPPQFDSPPVQLVVQVPLLQTFPTSQPRPQPPQFFGSLLSFTHVVPQRISPVAHVVGPPGSGVQRLATQTKPSGQGLSPGLPHRRISVREQAIENSTLAPKRRRARNFIGRRTPVKPADSTAHCTGASGPVVRLSPKQGEHPVQLLHQHQPREAVGQGEA